MRFLFTLVSLLALTNPLVSVSAAGGVGEPCCDNNQCTTQQTCNTGLTCCYLRPVWMEDLGGTCIDTKVSTCAACPVYNPNHPQTQVCPLSSPTCCGDCIDNTKQCCHHYGSYNFFQCRADQTCCGFDNGQNTCCESSQQCVNDVCVPKVSTTPAPGCVIPGDFKCGTQCFSPVTHVCANPANSFLCPVSFPSLCGSNLCYSSSQYTCSNGQLIPVTSTTQAPTSGPTSGPTSSPTSGPTSGGTQAPTAAPGCVIPGDQRCGDRCFSPVTHVCANAATSFLCPVAFPSLCGANACYSSSQYNCVNGQLVPK